MERGAELEGARSEDVRGCESDVQSDVMMVSRATQNYYSTVPTCRLPQKMLTAGYAVLRIL